MSGAYKRSLNPGAEQYIAALLPGLDPGIRDYVRVLLENGVETYESCEGGSGHAMPEPTVKFWGGPNAGWDALSVCLTFGLPVSELRRTWEVLDGNEPTGPHWELVFYRASQQQEKGGA